MHLFMVCELFQTWVIVFRISAITLPVSHPENRAIAAIFRNQDVEWLVNQEIRKIRQAIFTYRMVTKRKFYREIKSVRKGEFYRLCVIPRSSQQGFLQRLRGWGSEA